MAEQENTHNIMITSGQTKIYDVLDNSNSSITELKSGFPEVTNAYFADLEITKVEKEIQITRLFSAYVGREVYLVVETKNLKDKQLKVEICFGKGNLNFEENSSLKVLKDNVEQTKFNIKIGEFTVKNEVKDPQQFEDMAIVKIVLRPTDDNEFIDLQNKINRSTPFNTPIYIIVDAHSENIEFPKKRFIYKGEGEKKNYWNYFGSSQFNLTTILFPITVLPKNISYKNDWGHKDFQGAVDSNSATWRYPRRDKSGNIVRRHAGRDLYIDEGTTVHAIADGIVIEKKEFYQGTWQVTVRHNLIYKIGYHLIVRYGELDTNSVKNNEDLRPGKKVKAGDLIGNVGFLMVSDDKVKGGIRPNQEVNGDTGLKETINMLHFETYYGELGEDLITNPLSNETQPFKRRKDLFDSIEVLNIGYVKLFKESMIFDKLRPENPSSVQAIV